MLKRLWKWLTRPRMQEWDKLDDRTQQDCWHDE